jgi:ribosome hibernation promoting factor
MKLTVTARHLAISDADRALIARKVEHLDRILNDSAVSAMCVVAQERQIITCELTVHARGNHMLRGVGKDRRVGPATTAAVERVSQQALRLTDRWKTRRHQAGTRATAPAGAAASASEPAAPRVIRSRRYAVKPMTVDDAVLLLSAGDQSFLVFRHAVSNAVVVVYKRPDGNFGLIEPES